MEFNEFKERLWNLASDESVSVYEIETFLRNQFKQKHLPLVTSPISFENYCRCSLNKNDEIFNCVKRCSYNPIIKNIDLQRCNYSGQQVFYAAVPIEAEINCIGTSILEVTWEHISNYFLGYYFVTISRWITKRFLNVFVFPDLPNSEMISNGVDIQKLMNESDRIQNEDMPYGLSFLQYFRETFGIKDNKKVWYKISAAFYNCIMRLGKEENKNIDGIVYSSANTGKKGMNIALNKELIDTGVLHCDLVQMWMAKRNPKDPADIWFHPVSNKVVPNYDKSFVIELYPEFTQVFKNAPSLNIAAIV